MLTHRMKWSIGVAALPILMGTGCDSSSTTAPPTPQLALVGRLERGNTVRVVVHIGSDSVVGSQLTIQATPSGQATVGNDGTVTFLQAGSVTLQVRLPNDSLLSGTYTVVVPPSIYFDLSVNGNRDIYQAALDGGDLTQLTTANGDDVHPTVAGDLLVFTSYRNGPGDLYAITLSTGTEHQLTSVTETDPALSPDGQHLAFVHAVSGVDRVWVAASDGSGAVRLTTETAPSPEESPAWNPNGTVLFTSTANASADLSTVVAANAPTTASPVSAANTSFAEVEGAWSADGKEIAFVSTRSGGAELYVLNVASGQVTALSNAGTNVGQPTWLTDGRIVFTTFTGNTSQLSWIDPLDPTVVHQIPLSAGTGPQHPAGLR